MKLILGVMAVLLALIDAAIWLMLIRASPSNILAFLRDDKLTALAVSATPTPASRESDLRKAFGVAFHGHESESFGYTTLKFKASRLVPVTPETYALIAEGANTTGNACNGCQGKLRITYLKRVDGAFELLVPTIQLDVVGSSFGQPPRWNLSTGAGTPIVDATGSQTERGDNNCWNGVYRLTPTKIVSDKSAAKRARREHKECTSWAD